MTFLLNGKLAVGLKYTKDTMEIVEHLQRLGFVLFHHRNDSDQHLFRIVGEYKVVATDDVEPDRYNIINTTEMYVCVDIDVAVELDATQLQCSKKGYSSKTRYDAQYAEFENLQAK